MKQILLILALLLPVCASSQFKETFDGPSIHSANPWTGDGLSQFEITADKELHLVADPNKGRARIWLPQTFYQNMEWCFTVRMGFTPSNTNHIRIFLYSTLSASSNGIDEYYIQIGSNNQDITLKRLRETEKSPKTLITGAGNLLNKENVELNVKLTFEENKEWKLYTRLTEEDAYTLQGSFAEKLLNTRKEGYFRIECHYSKTRSSLFYFDDIYMSPEITPTEIVPENPEPPIVEPGEPSTPPDSSLPQLIEIIPQSTSELQFLFDNEVDISTASFSISGIGKAIKKTYGETKSVVNTLFSSPMQVNTEYTIAYAGLTSASGKQLPDGSWTAMFERDGEEPDTPSAGGSVWINEVMADPNGGKGLSETEYVELHNTSDNAAQLKGWTFNYGEKTSVVLADCSLPAGGYVVLFREGRTIEVDQPGQGMPLAKFPSSLANTGKTLALKDVTGKLIDEITYSKAKSGISWERSAEGWYLSTDSRGGTPGSKNSPSEVKPEEPKEPEKPEKPEEPEKPETPDEPDEPSIPEEPVLSDVMPQDIVLNELLPEPFAEGSEYFELYNRSGRVVSLKGLSVATRKADGSLSTHYPLSSIPTALPKDGYALLTKAAEGVSSCYLISAPEAIYELKLPVLANTSSTLVLFRSKDEVVIDEVCYSSRWHASSVKSKKGVALERIDPDARTQDVGNWTSASETAGYGTPGYRNSQMMKTEEGGVTGIESPLFIDATGFYSIAYHLDKPGYNGRAYLFDLSGRRVAEIANQQLLGVDGEFTWNGIALNGRRLGTGIYILYITLYHTDGQTRTYKKAFPVR